jgi:ATP-dependent DNA helicase RecQ
VNFTVLNLPWNQALECFETNALVSLQDSDEITSVSEHFYVQSGRPQLTLLITHRSKVSRHQAMLNTQTVSPQQSRNAIRAPLTKDEQNRYEAVRAFRNQRAIDLGRPPYALMTNAQLKEAAKLVTPNIAALKSIKGMGEAKINEFGADLISVLKSSPTNTESCHE